MKNKPVDVIYIDNVDKEYTIHHEKPMLTEKFIKGAKEEKFFALRSINVTIRKGECVGIIGPNGSGKTTLLKIIAGITTATNGTIRTSGNIVSLIDLEAGFHPDLTGIQNIFVNGMLLGMGRKEIEQKLKDIIAFADIGGFIDAPLFTYSNGMKLRLGFAIVVYTNPDIILFDEAMNVGDRDFQKKAFAEIHTFIRRGKTLLFVSHVSDLLKHYCSRILVMQHGRIVDDGGRPLIQKYLRGAYVR